MKNLFKLSEHVYVYLDTPTHSRRSQLLLLFSHTRRVMSIFFQHLYIQLFDFHFISNLRFILTLTKLKWIFIWSAWRFLLRSILDFNSFLFLFAESGLNALKRLLCIAFYGSILFERKKTLTAPHFHFSFSSYGLLRFFLF